MTKLRFGLIAFLLTSVLLFIASALAQVPLDPLMGAKASTLFPTYISHSCGVGDTAIRVEQYDERANSDATVTGAFSYRTTCAGSGRGSKATVYQDCFAVTFLSDRYTVIDRVRLAPEQTWKYGSAAQACSAL